MAEITLAADTGRPIGSRPARRLRMGGRVPGVVYGQGGEAVPVSVAWRELRQALTTEAGFNALINLEFDGSRELTIVKELQRDPVRRQVTHVDFLRISRHVAITVEVPVVLVGEAEKVTKAEGVVEHVRYDLEVKAKPGSIPGEITVDVSDMEIGDTIRIGDLALPPGVETEEDPDDPVVTARVSTVAAEVEEIEEAAAEVLAELAEAEGEVPAEAAEVEGEAAETEGDDEGAAERGDES